MKLNNWTHAARLGAMGALLVLAGTAGAQTTGLPATETILYHLTGSATDGELPTSLVQLPGGNLFGLSNATTAESQLDSVFFDITTGGTFSFLYNNDSGGFESTGYPVTSAIGIGTSGFIAGADGNLYGVTNGGPYVNGQSTASGTFYRVTPQGVATALYTLANFGVDNNPLFRPNNYNVPGLVQAKDGSFYGISQVGTYTGPGNGGIYQLTTSGGVTSLNVLYLFSAYTGSNEVNPDGALPQSALTQASDGNFYGTAERGGANGYGTVFSLNPNGPSFTTLHSFGPVNTTTGYDDVMGALPIAGLVQGADGNLYGTTCSGGVYNRGIIFRMALDGSGYTKLHDFGAPAYSDAGQTSILYLSLAASPTTVSVGQSFALNWSLDFDDGSCPADRMFIGQDGNFYGFTGGTPGSAEAGGQVMFKLTPAGQYSMLYIFGANANDGGPSSLMQASDGNFYGATFEGPLESGTPSPGNIYKISTTPTPAPPCTASNAWSGTEPASGSQSLSEAAPGTYEFTLACDSYLGQVQNSVSVTVTAAGAAPTVTITANPGTITLGQSSTLSWSSTNATSCTASGAWSGSETTSGSLSVKPSATGTSSYALSCSGSGGSANASTTVTVNAPAPTVIISASPATITLGQSSTLTWSSTNATSCTASGAWSGSEATSGTLGLKPGATGSDSYTLSCTGSGGSASATAKLTVNAPAPTVTVAANPAAISLGLASTLSWSSTNATACTASGNWSGSEATSGTLSVTPSTTGANFYTLSCTGAGGTTQATATIMVSACVPGTPNAAGAHANGSADAVTATVLGITLPTSLTGIPETSSQTGVGVSQQQRQSNALSIPGVLSTSLLTVGNTATVSAQAPQANDSAITETAKLNLLNGVVTADAVLANAQATATGGNSSFSAAGSTFLNLVIEGKQYENLQPNEQIPLPGLGAGAYVDLLEEQGSTAGPAPGQLSGGTYSADLIVNMIHIHVPGLLGLPATDVIVSHAQAHADFPQTLVCNTQ